MDLDYFRARVAGRGLMVTCAACGACVEDLKSLHARGGRLLPHGEDFAAFLEKLEEWSKDFEATGG